MTMVDPGRFPNIVAGAAGGRAGPDDAARPRRPRQPLRDGRDRHRPRRQGRSTASTPSASAPAPACTAPTGSPRTRSASASSSAAAPRCRRSTTRRRRPASRYAGDPIEPPTRATREAVWRLAGLERDAQGLDAARAGPVPARPAGRRRALKAREETRGSHARAEFPEHRPAARRAPHDPRPRLRDARASRHGRPPDRLGRRPHDERLRLVRRLLRARGPRRGRRPARLPRRRPRHAGARSSSRAAGSASPSSSAGSRRHLGVDADGLADRLMADVRARPRDARRRQPLPRARASGPRSSRNSWRRDDYDGSTTCSTRSSSRASSESASRTRGSTKRRSNASTSAERCVFVDDLGGNLKPANSLGMTTIRHERGFHHDRPARPPTSARVLLNAKSTNPTFELSVVAAKTPHRATEGTAAGEGSPGETAMYHFSRSIYRELAPDIIEDRSSTTIQRTTSASCARARAA